MKDLGAEEQMSNEAFWLFKQLNLHLEQELKFQPREKGLSLIERTVEVRSRRRALALGVEELIIHEVDPLQWELAV